MEPDKISKGKKLKCQEKPSTVNYTDQFVYQYNTENHKIECKNNSRSNKELLLTL